MKARALLTWLAVPLLLLLVACSSGGEDVLELEGASAVAQLQAAPDAAAAAGSGRMEMTMTFAGGGETYTLTASGAFRGTQATFTTDLGSLLAAGLGEEQPIPDGMDDPITVVVDGTTTYLDVPMLRMFTGTDGWLSVRPEDMGMAEDSLGLGFGASGNPAQVLESLRGVSDQVEVVGPDEVRGVDTTQYRVVVDLELAAARLPDGAREAFEQQMAGLGTGELPFDVWIGEDGLVYRMALDLADVVGAVADDGLDGFESGSMVIELFDYGAPVDIEIPDPAEVTPLAEVLGSFGGLDPSAALG